MVSYVHGCLLLLSYIQNELFQFLHDQSVQLDGKASYGLEAADDEETGCGT